MKYVPPIGPVPARIMLVGEAPGTREVAQGRPFCGPSGKVLDRMLRQIGIKPEECFITNVLRFQPPGNNAEHFLTKKKTVGRRQGWAEVDGYYCSPTALEHRGELLEEIRRVRPKVIIPLGELALWAVTGRSEIMKWRGSVIPLHGAYVVPTLHPAFILRLWGCRPVVVHDLKRALRILHNPPGPVRTEFITRPSFTQAATVLEQLLARLHVEKVLLACDIETRAGQIACVGLAWSPTEAISLPFLAVERPEGYWDLPEELEITRLLRDVLTHPNAQITGQNFLFDAQYIARQWGFLPRLVFDTKIAQHVLFPDLPSVLFPKSLHFLATLFCALPQYWKDEGKTWVPGMPEDQLWTYNCKDAVVTWEVTQGQMEALRQTGLTGPFQFQMELWYPLLKMMLRGIRIDQARRAELAQETQAYHDRLVSELAFLVDHPLNPRSDKQLKALFYHDLRQAPIRNRKTKSLTLDEEALERIANREPILRPLVERIHLARSASVFHSTFLDSAPDALDGRMRCLFDPAKAKTYRLSSSQDAFGSGMNLQNIPAETDKFGRARPEALPNIRSLFLPDPGYILVNADLDRADLQVVVWEADDAELKQMLREGADIHSENAKVVGLTRQEAKMFCHATNYGASARRLAISLGRTVYEMEQAQKRWFSAHPGITRWHHRVEKELEKTNSVSNRFGFRITYYERSGKILPQALAWIPQSTVAIVINKGIVNLHRHLPEAQLLLQVHDSVLFQLPDPQLLPQAQKLLQIPIPYEDPLIIPVTLKTSQKSWGDCK